MNLESTVRLLPLGSLCEILDSRRKPITKRDREAGPFPYYGATGVLDHVAGYIFDERLVLVGEDGAKWGGGEATAFAVDGKVWVNNHAHVLRPDRKLILDQWLIHYLNFSDLSEFVSGLTVPKLNQASLREIPVPVPAISEQQRIVDILDEAFAGIATAKANAEKSLRNARDVWSKALHQMFERVEAKRLRLGDVTEVQSGGTPTVSKKQFWGGGIPWYSSGELNNFTTTDPERTISTEGLNGSNAKKFPCESLLIGMYDTAALKMSILDREAAFNQAIAGAKPSNKLDTRYLLHAISVQKEDLLGQRRGVRQKNLSLGKIKDIMIPLPSMAAQKKVVVELQDVADEVSRLESLYERKLTALDELKQSLLHQAFSGQL